MKTIFDFIAGNVWWWVGGFIVFFLLMAFFGFRWRRSGQTETDGRKALIVACQVSVALYAICAVLAMAALIIIVLRRFVS